MDKETIKEAIAYEKEYAKQLKLFVKTNPEFIAHYLLKGVEEVGAWTVIANIATNKKHHPLKKIATIGVIGAAYIVSNNYRKNIDARNFEEADRKFEAALRADKKERGGK